MKQYSVVIKSYKLLQYLSNYKKKKNVHFTQDALPTQTYRAVNRDPSCVISLKILAFVYPCIASKL